MVIQKERNLDAFLARFFSESTIRSFIKNQDSAHPILKEFYHLMRESEIQFDGSTYRDLFEFAFTHLKKNYRNEYIYKNAIAKNILLGKHSLNTSFMLQEFRIGKCKADTLVLNGTANVYEIKSELDSLDRLQKQIDTYTQVFDMVHVITYPGQGEKIKQVVPKSIGVMELSRKNSISILREAKSGKKNIVPSMLFDSLRKSEYQAIIRDYYGHEPIVPNTQAYQVYKDLFVKIKPSEAHDLAVTYLKKRGDSILLKDFISSVPECFKSLSISAHFSKDEIDEISKLFNSDLPIAG
ncbi:sce7726 family protein [Bdellovibrio sp.]|uniref:sce7726 family protein n=1 Tax=Bdellovibrio sp. TaxID=28201 RepID=UPI0039E2900F